MKYLERNVTRSFIILPAERELDQQFNNTSSFVVINAVITHGANCFLLCGYKEDWWCSDVFVKNAACWASLCTFLNHLNILAVFVLGFVQNWRFISALWILNKNNAPACTCWCLGLKSCLQGKVQDQYFLEIFRHIPLDCVFIALVNTLKWECSVCCREPVQKSCSWEVLWMINKGTDFPHVSLKDCARGKCGRIKKRGHNYQNFL